MQPPMAPFAYGPAAGAPYGLKIRVQLVSTGESMSEQIDRATGPGSVHVVGTPRGVTVDGRRFEFRHIQ